MEATLKSPSPSPVAASKPDWLVWKERFFDGIYPECLTEEAKARGYTEANGYGTLHWNRTLSNEKRNGLCECCGSMTFSPKNGFKGLKAKDFDDYIEQVWGSVGNDRWWKQRIGILMCKDANAEQTKAFFGMPEADTVALELQDGDKTCTIVYREVFNAESV